MGSSSLRHFPALTLQDLHFRISWDTQVPLTRCSSLAKQDCKFEDRGRNKSFDLGRKPHRPGIGGSLSCQPSRRLLPESPFPLPEDSRHCRNKIQNLPSITQSLDALHHTTRSVFSPHWGGGAPHNLIVPRGGLALHLRPMSARLPFSSVLTNGGVQPGGPHLMIKGLFCALRRRRAGHGGGNLMSFCLYL
ncbi:hypothetical protein HJG60_007790 [Phyllostomus discolor]|uniref:Uncharacterized protein n=1 Tax=Phyllostomus discolor TaxID=89673 RepID=A0A834BD23_9CHIR|nr:hypothetical protein HJG60_007790 [Phyllostomus discolor]